MGSIASNSSAATSGKQTWANSYATSHAGRSYGKGLRRPDGYLVDRRVWKWPCIRCI
jgi:hypothetical protein